MSNKLLLYKAFLEPSKEDKNSVTTAPRTRVGAAMKARIISGAGTPLKVKSLESGDDFIRNRLFFCWGKVGNSWRRHGLLLADSDGTLLNLQFVLDRNTYVRERTIEEISRTMSGTGVGGGNEFNARVLSGHYKEEFEHAFDSSYDLQKQVSQDLSEQMTLERIADGIEKAREKKNTLRALHFPFIGGRDYYLCYCPMEMLSDEKMAVAENRTKTLPEILQCDGKPKEEWLINDTNGVLFTVSEELVGRGWIDVPLNLIEWIARVYDITHDINGLQRQYVRVRNYHLETISYLDTIQALYRAMLHHPDDPERLYRRFNFGSLSPDPKETLYRLRKSTVGKRIQDADDFCKELAEMVRNRYIDSTETSQSLPVYEKELTDTYVREMGSRCDKLYSILTQPRFGDLFREFTQSRESFVFTHILDEERLSVLLGESWAVLAFHPDENRKRLIYQDSILPFLICVSSTINPDASGRLNGIMSRDTLKALYPQKTDAEIEEIYSETESTLRSEWTISEYKSRFAGENLKLDGAGDFTKTVLFSFVTSDLKKCHDSFGTIFSYFDESNRNLAMSVHDIALGTRLLCMYIRGAAHISLGKADGDDEYFLKWFTNQLSTEARIDCTGISSDATGLSGANKVGILFSAVGLFSAVYGAHKVLSRIEKENGGKVGIKDCLELYQSFSAGAASAFDLADQTLGMNTALGRRIGSALKFAGVGADLVSLSNFAKSCVTYYKDEEHDLLFLEAFKFSAAMVSLNAQLVQLLVRKIAISTVRKTAISAASKSVGSFIGLVMFLVELPAIIESIANVIDLHRYRTQGAVASIATKSLKERFDRELYTTVCGKKYRLGKYSDDSGLVLKYKADQQGMFGGYSTEEFSLKYDKLADYLSGLKSLKGFVNHVRFWNLDEESGTRALIDAGVPAPIIAYVMGRGTSDVNEKVFGFGRELRKDLRAAFKERGAYFDASAIRFLEKNA